MGLTLKERKPIIREKAILYKKANKKEKGIILDNLIKLTGYNRSYARSLLRNHGRIIKYNKKIFIGNLEKGYKKREKEYNNKVFIELKKIWEIMDMPCGKRLEPMLKEIIPKLESLGELEIDKITRERLLKISASTIDRLLRVEKGKYSLKGKGHTKPGSMLKNNIPIRTFSDWDDKKAGFVEIDLVGHDGGISSGDFMYSLNVTDVSTGWTETKAIKNKARKWVFEALIEIKNILPFDLLGIDSDNGSEFINNHLYNYCLENKITFTRTRSYRKNDNCFIEQKNYTVVRKAVGYNRYDTEEALKILNELYWYLRLYNNFFQPSMKLISKTRIGSKMRKQYDKAKTPFRRVLESGEIPGKNKKALQKMYETLNPVELKIKITRLQNKLLNLKLEVI